MKQLTLELPDELAELLPEAEAISLARQAWVLSLVRQGKLGVGRGAELLGMHLSEFARLLAEHDIPYFDYSEQEWASEEQALHDFTPPNES
jgi:predicted HTH domain antitoxin